MSYTVTPDYSTLPDALLPLAKQHCRAADFDDDDDVITEYLGWAIGYLEHFWGWQVFGASVAWTPEPAGLSSYPCPVQPVSDFTVTSGGQNVSAEYALEKTSPTSPVFLVHSDGTAFPADASVTLQAGFADVASLPPPAKADILRVTGTLYEYRESVSQFSLEAMPDWLNAQLTGLWIPRA